MASWEIDPDRQKFWLSVKFLKVYEQKKTSGNKIICRQYKGFWLHSQRKYEAISTRLWSTYWDTKVNVCSPDGDADYFDIVEGVQQEGTLAPYFIIIRLDYVLRRSIDKIKENCFKLTKERSRRNPAKNNYRRRLRRW